MKLEILDYDGARNYVPKNKTYAIRIFDALQPTPIHPLKENDNWVKINEYIFDDIWPTSWKEFEKDVYLNSMGWDHTRSTLFTEETAIKILRDFEKHKDNIEAVLVHCNFGKNRSPAVGIALNEKYDWGIENLKEKYPEYRRYIYETMKKFI